MSARPGHPTGETATTCPYCGVGCGVLVRPSADGEHARVTGDPEHPANFGRLCSKGSALGETLQREDRLLQPEINSAQVSWDTALDHVATGLSQTRAEHGPDSIAFYVSGQLLTEDYYVANKLMKGFIGSANIDTNSRLCMASSVAGHKRAFGADTVPGVYEDLELADLIIMVGSNFAWCHPVLHQRVLAAKAKRKARLVVIDPRKTATTEAADLHLPIAPGADVLLFNALFVHLATSPARDQRFIDASTSGFDPALAAARAVSLEETAQRTGLAHADILRFFRWAEQTPAMVTIYSQGVNQSSAGTDKVNAILNSHLATGRIGKPGMGPFSITGQPNAMGGREVGGLANQLASHMDFTEDAVDRVGRFWSAPAMAQGPGLKAVDMFQAIADGRVKALWVMATNPVVSMPDADAVKAAIDACPLVIVSDVVATADTVQRAHVRLPATAWGEKTGTVTNSERRISRQRSFLTPPGAARHDWDIIADVARRMGFAGFEYNGPADVFREYAALSAFENDGARDFDIGAYADLSTAQYDALAPAQWPQPRQSDNQTARRAGAVQAGQHRFFADGRFYTPDQRARFIATPYRAPGDAPSPDYPLILNTGRVRDHWHTMTRTGKSARLSGHIAEPFLELHPKDAAALGLQDADLARVRSAYGKAVLRVLITERCTPGTVFAPMHWTAEFASHGRIDALTAPIVDPVSGQPELKHTPVAVEKHAFDWCAFGVFAERPPTAVLDRLAYWAAARAPQGWRVEMAGRDRRLTASACLEALVGPSEAPDVTRYDDARQKHLRRARFENDRLAALMLAAYAPHADADRAWLSAQIGEPCPPEQRMILLAGRAPAGQARGRIVCTCLGVGAEDIARAASAGAATVEAIGAATCAGTNCGSCRPEIATLLASLRAKDPEPAVAAE